MKKHRHYEHLIDEYLLGKLKPEDQDEFEAHYFICPHCFAKLDQQSEIVQILKKEGMLETYGVACEHVRPAAGLVAPAPRPDRDRPLAPASGLLVSRRNPAFLWLQSSIGRSSV